MKMQKFCINFKKMKKFHGLECVVKSSLNRRGAKFCCRDSSISGESDNVDDRRVNQTASAVYDYCEEGYVNQTVQPSPYLGINIEKNTTHQYESLKK